MRYRDLICLFLLVLFTGTGTAAELPKAEKGILDLRKIRDPFSFVMNLNGYWEFYWNRMLTPDDFTADTLLTPYYGRVPAYWTEYGNDSIRTERTGFATYRLRILLPENFSQSLALDLPAFDSSYEIYVDGKNLGENGIPGKTKEETKPEYRRNFFRLSPTSDTITILINVSNFHHRKGGFWLPARLGTFSEVQRRMAGSWAASWAVISMLIGFSIFFLYFLFISPGEKIMGYFSMATIGLALRPLFTSHFLIQNLTDVNWTWMVRFEYISMYIVMTGWVWFARCLYPSRFIRIVSIPVTVFYALAFLLTLLLPVRIFSLSALATYAAVAILSGYLLFRSFRSAVSGNRLDLVYFLAFLLLLLGAYHDIRVSTGKSTTSLGYSVTYLIVIFVFLQAGLLLYKWVKAYFEKERLRTELEFMNRNLEEIVNQRTQELKMRTLEIENKNTRIALQNKQLSDTIQLKNRVFSVIAHDLRGPVVNILYMLNLLKEKEYKDQYDSFANSSIQYAQQVISLLENMLVWGRGQEEKLKFSPESHDLANVILTNLSIFKETADKKDIIINFTQKGSSVAYFDKDLLDIVVRNLMSNSIKYTPRGGRISILLTDNSQGWEGIMLKICDNGTGMSEERQKKLFRVSEIDSTPGTENEKGTGLGLKLCYDLVRINNGSITVKSRPGEGTCFMISLPRR
ncbi:MAG: HAMP domain-containing histidine kinase [Bacteroidales bacterium]|nr:HAMP domain-containing histidine kinase [Bacteroidales bacterium]MCU0408683.1 HAMP domain-containing histidine kinase [Bacteroidales bacterium]